MQARATFIPCDSDYCCAFKDSHFVLGCKLGHRHPSQPRQALPRSGGFPTPAAAGKGLYTYNGRLVATLEPGKLAGDPDYRWMAWLSQVEASTAVCRRWVLDNQ